MDMGGEQIGRSIGIIIMGLILIIISKIIIKRKNENKKKLKK